LSEPTSPGSAPADAPAVPEPAANAPHISHFVADHDETTLGEIDALDESVPPTSLWREAGRKLVRRPLFIVAVCLIILILAVSLAPGLFASADINTCYLDQSLLGPSRAHPMGTTKLGCDVYTRVIHGARWSVAVGVLTTVTVLIIGGLVGALAGWFGGWLDAILSRLGDIFYAIPTVLAALVFLNSMKDKPASVMVLLVVAIITAFAWPQMCRVTRGAVLAVKNADFVTSARALGVSNGRILLRHIVPNAAAPMIVMATTSLGTYIVLEATLSFLGLGLPLSMHSWGSQVASAQGLIRNHPDQLFYPSAALALTVLAFIMLGDAVRDALDPKAAR